MATSFRKSEILEIARTHGRVSVDDLAQRFGVAMQTIRRDLTDLANEGRLDRVHGGAMMPAGARNIGYQDRRSINMAAKTAIAQACAARVPDNSSLLLNIGTTTEAVAEALLDHRDLTVVTNNLNVATTLARNDSFEIVVTGGVLRHSDGGLVGDLALGTIDAFKVDLAVIGASAIDLDGDLLDYDQSEVRVSQSIIARARNTCLVADRSKFDRVAPVRIASLRDIGTFITDVLPDPLRARCIDWGTEIVETGPAAVDDTPDVGQP